MERIEQQELAHSLSAGAPGRQQSGVGIIDRELRFMQVDTVLAQLNGLPPEAHIGRRLHEVVPTLAATIEPLLRLVLETGEPLREVEIHGELRAGTPGRWLVTYEPVRTRGGTVLAVECVVRQLEADAPDPALTATQAALQDVATQLVAERRRKESALRAAQEERALLDTLIGSAPIGFDFVDTELRFVRINEYLAANNGLPVAAHLGRTVREILPDLADTVEPLLREVMSTGRPITDIEVTGCTPAAPGQERIWRESLYPVFDEGGRMLGVGAIVAEITEHRRVSAALHKAAARTAALQEITAALTPALTPMEVAEVVIERAVASLGARSGVVALIDEEGTTLRAVAALGYPEADLAAWHWPLDEAEPLTEAVRHGRPVLVRDRAEAERLYPHLAAARAIVPDVAWANLPLITKRGVEGALSLGFSTPQLFDPDDQALLHVIAQQCAQALERAQLYLAERRAREEAEAAVHERDDLIALISHDLKNPLTVIQGQAQLMARRLGRSEIIDTARIERGLGLIAEAAVRMSVQIEELLDVAQLRAGRSLHLDLQPTDLVAISERAFGLAQSHSELHSMRLSTALTTLICHCDGPRIERVLTNLLSNALKYSPAGGEIVVAVARDEAEGRAWAMLSVTDQGIGIPADDLPRIFDRFHRAANTGGQIRGTGLGLASAQRIVAQHGGTLEVASVEGEGSTFTVRLPL